MYCVIRQTCLCINNRMWYCISIAFTSHVASVIKRFRLYNSKVVVNNIAVVRLTYKIHGLQWHFPLGYNTCAHTHARTYIHTRARAPARTHTHTPVNIKNNLPTLQVVFAIGRFFLYLCVMYTDKDSHDNRYYNKTEKQKQNVTLEKRKIQLQGNYSSVVT